MTIKKKQLSLTSGFTDLIGEQNSRQFIHSIFRFHIKSFSEMDFDTIDADDLATWAKETTDAPTLLRITILDRWVSAFGMSRSTNALDLEFKVMSDKFSEFPSADFFQTDRAQEFNLAIISICESKLHYDKTVYYQRALKYSAAHQLSEYFLDKDTHQALELNERLLKEDKLLGFLKKVKTNSSLLTSSDTNWIQFAINLIALEFGKKDLAGSQFRQILQQAPKRASSNADTWSKGVVSKENELTENELYLIIRYILLVEEVPDEFHKWYPDFLNKTEVLMEDIDGNMQKAQRARKFLEILAQGFSEMETKTKTQENDELAVMLHLVKIYISHFSECDLAKSRFMQAKTLLNLRGEVIDNVKLWKKSDKKEFSNPIDVKSRLWLLQEYVRLNTQEARPKKRQIKRKNSSVKMQFSQSLKTVVKTDLSKEEIKENQISDFRSIIEYMTSVTTTETHSCLLESLALISKFWQSNSLHEFSFKLIKLALIGLKHSDDFNILKNFKEVISLIQLLVDTGTEIIKKAPKEAKAESYKKKITDVVMDYIEFSNTSQSSKWQLSIENHKKELCQVMQLVLKVIPSKQKESILNQFESILGKFKPIILDALKDNSWDMLLQSIDPRVEKNLSELIDVDFFQLILDLLGEMDNAGSNIKKDFEASFHYYWLLVLSGQSSIALDLVASKLIDTRAIKKSRFFELGLNALNIIFTLSNHDSNLQNILAKADLKKLVERMDTVKQGGISVSALDYLKFHSGAMMFDWLSKETTLERMIDRYKDYSMRIEEFSKRNNHVISKEVTGYELFIHLITLLYFTELLNKNRVHLFKDDHYKKLSSFFTHLYSLFRDANVRYVKTDPIMTRMSELTIASALHFASMFIRMNSVVDKSKIHPIVDISFKFCGDLVEMHKPKEGDDLEGKQKLYEIQLGYALQSYILSNWLDSNEIIEGSIEMIMLYAIKSRLVGLIIYFFTEYVDSTNKSLPDTFLNELETFQQWWIADKMISAYDELMGNMPKQAKSEIPPVAIHLSGMDTIIHKRKQKNRPSPPQKSLPPIPQTTALPQSLKTQQHTPDFNPTRSQKGFSSRKLSGQFQHHLSEIENQENYEEPVYIIKTDKNAEEKIYIVDRDQDPDNIDQSFGFLDFHKALGGDESLTEDPSHTNNEDDEDNDEYPQTFIDKGKHPSKTGTYIELQLDEENDPTKNHNPIYMTLGNSSDTESNSSTNSRRSSSERTSDDEYNDQDEKFATRK